MKKLLILFVAITFTSLSFAQNNAPLGADNYYESLYGTVQGDRGATDALVYVDYSLLPDYVVPALTNQGFNVTVAIDWTDFNTQLASGNFGLAVAFTQNWGIGLSLTDAQNYINGGGCMIFADWHRTNTFANLFEANFTGSNNLTPFTISDAMLSNGITNPVAISSPGWGTWSTGLTAIGSGEVLATFPNGDAAVIRGNGGNTIILGYLSDTPPDADRQMLFENVIKSTTCGGFAQEIPVSNWAIILGVLLIGTFIVVRYRRTLA